MAEIKIVATIIAKDGSRDALREILAGMAAKSREESGCVGYELYESAATAGTFITIERWADDAALERHMISPNLKFAAAAMRQHLVTGPALHPLIPVS